MTCPSLQQHRSLYALRESEPPQPHTAGRDIPCLCNMHKSQCQYFWFPACFFFSFLKGYSIRRALFISAAYEEAVRRSLRPQLRLFFSSGTGLSDKLKHETGSCFVFFFKSAFSTNLASPFFVFFLVAKCKQPATLTLARELRLFGIQMPLKIHFVCFIIPPHYLRPHTGSRLEQSPMRTLYTLPPFVKTNI